MVFNNLTKTEPSYQPYILFLLEQWEQWELGPLMYPKNIRFISSPYV